MKQALESIKIIDLTRVLAGPYATMILADLGADVIKIELPEIGDDSRCFGPFVNNESAYFMNLNRNKKSITLNLKTEEGKKVFLQLIEKADVLVENFRPGVMEKLGIGYEYLSTINPKLIYAACSGFGQTGPYSNKPAYDAIVQALGGIMSVTGQDGGKPTRVGTSIGDITAGLYTCIGILTALISRSITCKGQKVDVAMFDCQVSILENAISRFIITSKIPKPEGNKHSSIVPFETFDTIDSEIMVAAGNNSLWANLCEAIGMPELIKDESYNDNFLRHKNYKQLREVLADKFIKKTTIEWQNILDKHGVPNGPINTVDKLLNDIQVKARDMIVEIDHPSAGRLKVTGIPIKLSNTPGSIRTPAPTLGQHTEEVLKNFLGYDSNKICLLKEHNVI